MRALSAGGIEWAKGAPPPVAGPWEAAICDCAEKGDERFVRILRDHVAARRIRSERAKQVLAQIDGVTECVAASVEV